jgi:hypothetical protein
MTERKESMKSERLTNTLLALIFLALLANLVVPALRTNEASAAYGDSRTPAEVAATAGVPALDKVAAQISKALVQIAESNRQIAGAIRENAQSGEHIADSLRDVADQVKGIELKVAAPPSRRAPAPGRSSERQEEDDPDWWKGRIED